MVIPAGAGEFRTFTDTQGREVKARIVSVDDRTGKVELEREGGKTFKVSPGLFTEADQEYIQAWTTANLVLSEKNLIVTFSKKSEPVDKEATAEHAGFSGEAVYYEVTLENRSRQPVENLVIDYQYFITMDIKDRDEIIRRVSGSANIERIEPSASVMFTTEAATFGERIRLQSVYGSDGRFSGYDEYTFVDENLEGLWLKIHGPEFGGGPVERDVCHPSGLQKYMTWGEPLSPEMEQLFQRGPSVGGIELNTWVVEALQELDLITDEKRMRDISDGIEFFAGDKLGRGSLANLIAVGFYRKGLYDLSVHWLERCLEEEGTDDPSAFSVLLLAELYATIPSLADGEKALALIDRNIDIMRTSSPVWTRSVMAMAYARSGKFDQAVKQQEEAKNALSALNAELNKPYQPFFERCMKLFVAGQPYDLDPADPRCWRFQGELSNQRLREEQKARGESVKDETLWPDDGEMYIRGFAAGLGVND
jgi:tetratricopeptide (TPR) repeat protein